MARRSRSQIFSMSLITDGPGKWKVRYHAVDGAISTTSCMKALEQAMRASPLDVFWFQERWKIYFGKGRNIHEWLGSGSHGEGTPHRALLWMAGMPDSWEMPAEWIHPDVIYEIVPKNERSLSKDRDCLSKLIAEIDAAKALPVDYILTCNASKALLKAARREAIPLVSLSPPP